MPLAGRALVALRLASGIAVAVANPPAMAGDAAPAAPVATATAAAADPRQPAPAPVWQGPPGLEQPPAEPRPQDWAAANAAVAAFPRGHIDLLRWEAQHLGPAPMPAAHTGGRP